MIYTVTFNPALDYVVRMDGDLLPGMTNRSSSEEYYFGGKGINVSMVLSELGLKSTALGFIAGFTGHAIDEGVKAAGIETDFIELKDGISRINVKLKATEETEINAQGPKIDEESQLALYNKLSKLVAGDVLILAGSIPKTLPDDVYEKILSMLDGKGIEFVVDATKDLLTNVLKYHPFLIKPNNFELGEIVGKVLTTDDEIYEGAKKLQEMGSEIWLNTKANKVVSDDSGKIIGVETDAGFVETNYVIANMNPQDAYNKLLDKRIPVPAREFKRLNAQKHGVRFFEAYVGLNKSVEELGIKDYTIFMPGDLDTEKNYAYSKSMELNTHSVVVIYNVVNPEASPKGTTAMTFTVTYTYDPQGNWTKAIVKSKMGKQPSRPAFEIIRAISY